MDKKTAIKVADVAAERTGVAHAVCGMKGAGYWVMTASGAKSGGYEMKYVTEKDVKEAPK